MYGYNGSLMDQVSVKTMIVVFKRLNAIIQTKIVNFLKNLFFEIISLVKRFDENGCYIHHLLAAYFALFACCSVKSKLSFQNLDSMIGSTVQFV